MKELTKDIGKLLDYIEGVYKETKSKNFVSFYKEYKKIFIIKNNHYTKPRCGICDNRIIDEELFGMKIEIDNRLFLYLMHIPCLDENVKLHIIEQGLAKELSL